VKHIPSLGEPYEKEAFEGKGYRGGDNQAQQRGGQYFFYSGLEGKSGRVFKTEHKPKDKQSGKGRKKNFPQKNHIEHADNNG
jgi:hypothetical protein